MKDIWRWIIGIVVGLVIVAWLFFGRSDRQAYETAKGEAQTSFQDISWKWAKLTDRAKGTTTTIPDPQKYTILFKTDGTFEGKADCNNISGTYSQENGGFFIKLGPTTMAFCGEGSLDQQYLTLLGSVVAGGPDGAGGFALETGGGAQRMEFKQ
jgi:heat shock protein HslJ